MASAPNERKTELQQRFRQWASSFISLDPRVRIHRFFQEVAQRGELKLQQERRNKQPSHQETRMSSYFNLASVFTVWRPCSNEAIRKMMEGKGVGKGLDIKGKSAKTGKLSGYVPFLQIHNEADKSKIDIPPRDARMRIFYGSSKTRQDVISILAHVRDEMVRAVDASEHFLSQMNRDSFSSERHNSNDSTRIASEKDDMIDDSARSANILSYEDESRRKMIWEMEDPSIDLVDDYNAQSIYGIEIAERLFWEGFVIRQNQHCHLWDWCDTERNDRNDCSSISGHDGHHRSNFAKKLMQRMLKISATNNGVEKDNGNGDLVVEWVKNATSGSWSFIIMDPCRFEREVIRPIRKHDLTFPNNISSFVGELRLCGFSEEATGKGHARFHHRYFQKDNVNMCLLIGSEHDTGRQSMTSLQEANFNSLRTVPPTRDRPRVVLWHFEEDSDNRHSDLCPHNLLMAYEENGKVVPVVSDFDGFLVGTKRIRFDQGLPLEQVELVRAEIQIAKEILEGRASGDSWATRWMYAARDYKAKQPPIPRFGFGDDKSYRIMEGAVSQLSRTDGAVRHGAECFNYTMPQEMDPSFLVISDTIEGAVLWKYVGVAQLVYFLHNRAKDGYTFPLNPKWVLCDPGWYRLYEKMVQTDNPNIKASYNIWFPPESGIRDLIDEVQRKHPTGLSFAKNDNSKKQEKCGLSIVTTYSLQAKPLSGEIAMHNRKPLILHLCHGSVIGFVKENLRAGLVCATNESCVPICGGVMQAVVEAGGQHLLDDAKTLPILSETSFGPVRCVTGDAIGVSSKGGSNYGTLGVSTVIFAAGPYYGDTFRSDRDVSIKDDLLRSAYWAAIRRAKEMNLQAVAFSLLSAGKRGCRWDPQRVLRLAVLSLSDFREGFGSIEEIHLCAFTADEVSALGSIASILL